MKIYMPTTAWNSPLYPELTLQDLLPETAFVPFSARKLAHPWVVYVNPSFDGAASWIEHFAFMIPSADDSSDSFTPSEKRFLAERYGGLGLSSHGGGVRVGLSGHYEVKGIGANPLRGKASPRGDSFWHSHGGLALVDAIQEAAWGEVFSAVLPFGAARLAAIVSTNSLCWYQTSGGASIQAVRALAIRQAVLRPGHFTRAIYFRPYIDLQVVSDATRVAQNCSRLPELLPLSRADSRSFTPTSVEERVAVGLREFACRCARQCARARAKRLMHGSMTASNVGLDGRWLDYGTASAMPNYANTNYFGLPPHVPTFWEDHLLCIQTFRDLCFYIHKYLPQVRHEATDINQLLDLFRSVYGRTLQQEFVHLAGIPEQLYSSDCPQSELQSFADTLLQVSRYGVHNRFRLATTDLSKCGQNSLGIALMVLAAFAADDTCAQRLNDVVRSVSLRDKLCSMYRSFFSRASVMAAQNGISVQALSRLALLNAARATLPAKLLYRPILWRRCEDIVDKCHGEKPALRASIEELLREISTFTRHVLAPLPEVCCVTWGDRHSSVLFDGHRDSLRISRHGLVTEAPWEALGEMRQNSGRDDLFELISADSAKLARREHY